MFKPRPFGLESQQIAASQQPLDLNIELMRAQRYGHNLTQVQWAEPAPDASVQQKNRRRQPLPSRPQTEPLLQAKLAIGEPEDKYEQEADRVASQVVPQINTLTPQQSAQSQSVQREAIPDEKEELMKKPEISAIQRQEKPEAVQRETMPEEEELQTKSTLQRREAIGGGEASMDVESAINSDRGGGQPLEAGLQRSMEQAFGADFGGVKVHTDAQADQLNRSVQAKAFTTGQDVFFRSGEYNPGSRGGQELIAHELTHVVQQREVPGTPYAVQQGTASASVQRKFSKATSDMNIDLDTEEKSGGHTIERHVGKEKEYVKDRIRAQGIDIASTYPDLETAHAAINANIRANHTQINNMIFDPNVRDRQTTAVKHTSERVIGGYLDEHNIQDKKGRPRGRKAFKQTRNNVVVVRKLAGEAFLLTSFPEP